MTSTNLYQQSHGFRNAREGDRRGNRIGDET